MSPEERRAAVEAWIVPRLSQVAALQEQRLSLDGRYWHGPWTHSAPPQDGPGGPPDLSRAAEGRPSWAGVGAGGLFPGVSRARTQVDEYSGPLGRGWVLRAQFGVGDEVHEWTLPTGPHAGDFPSGWAVLTEEEEGV